MHLRLVDYFITAVRVATNRIGSTFLLELESLLFKWNCLCLHLYCNKPASHRPLHEWSLLRFALQFCGDGRDAVRFVGIKTWQCISQEARNVLEERLEIEEWLTASQCSRYEIKLCCFTLYRCFITLLWQGDETTIKSHINAFPYGKPLE